MDFPIYARHEDHSVWYQIHAADRFTEWKRLGASKTPLPDNFIRSEIQSTDYSTALYIDDLIKAVKAGSLKMVELEELEAAVGISE